jgi:MSHA biogenesis protein MshQ
MVVKAPIAGWLRARVGSLWRQLAALCALALLPLAAQAIGLLGATFTSTSPTQTAVAIVYVKPSETFTANVSGNTAGSNTNWRSTQWRIATSVGTPYTCADTGNQDTNNSNATFVVTPTLTAPATAGTYNAYFIADSANNCGGSESALLTISNAIVVDGTAPVATIACSSPASCGANTTTVSWSVTFSEPVTGLTTANFSLTSAGGVSGASITGVSGSGSSWTVTANTGSNNGTLGLNMASNLTTILDRAGNNPVAVNASGGNTMTIDKTAPTASIACNSPPDCGTSFPTNASSVSWLVTFSESVTGGSTANFTLATSGLSGATITGISGSGATRTVTASTGSGSGTIGLNLSTTLTDIKDVGGNSPAAVSASAANTYTIDKTVPTATITCGTPTLCGAANPTTSAQVTWNVTFSESVTAPVAANFGFSGTGSSGATIASIGSIGSSGTSWTVTANVGGDGTLGLNLAYLVPAISDTANNAVAATVTATAANTYTVSNVPTATISCSSPSACGTLYPTNLASVTWAVTFSESVTGVALANFSLTGTGTSGASLTSVSGSGATWYVTAATGVNGTLGLNLSSPTGITDSSSLTPAAVSAVPANTYTKDSAASGECFLDDFNRASLGSNWSTTSSSGSFGQPLIVNGRLRLTNSTTNASTAAHLQRIFPAAGNKIVVEFDYYSYNGNGADGVGVTLSDATIAPVAGAFGGSLGYAQKNTGSDCPTVGGCPGFAGGWIGVGFDEYGNFSAATEGRVGGSTVLPDAVVVRGSGSGLSGYSYHERSAALSPGIDVAGATAGPAHRYRITIDHTDGVHAYVSVERDATVGHTGYTTLIPAYDAKAKSGQAAVPENWFLSYTASTGTNYNTHEIAALQVCTTRPIAVPTLHHVRVIHDGAALTCAPETVTLRACADATCSSLYLGSVTADLTATAGSTWSSDPVTFSGGQATLTMSRASPGSTTLGGTVTSPSATLGNVQCYNINVAGDCILPFSAASCAFDAVQADKAAGTPIYTKLAGTAFNIDVLALTAGVINTSFVGRVTPVLVDQTVLPLDANGCGQTVLATAVPFAGGTNGYIDMTASNAGRAKFTFNYAQAAANVRVKVTSGATTACSNDNFAIRPATFRVTSASAGNTAANGLATPVFANSYKANYDAFPLTATPYNSSNAVITAGYAGTALINNNRLRAHDGAITTGTVSGTFNPASSSASSGTSFTYSESGSFMFNSFGVYDSGSFVAVDASKAPIAECRTDGFLGSATAPYAPNDLDLDGKYGCFFGTDSLVDTNDKSRFFGRFKPDHFDTVIALNNNVPMTCPAGLVCPTTYNGAVYSRQPFKLTVIAKRFGASSAANDGVVKNYNGATYANPVTLTAWSGLGLSAAANANPPALPAGNALAPAAVAAADFVEGIATVAAQQYNMANPFSYATPYANNWPSPTDVYIRATETAADSITSLRTVTTTSVEAGIKVLAGRMNIVHTYGSELLPLRVPVLAQYWDGSRWVTSYVDNTSTFGSVNVDRISYINKAGTAYPLNAANSVPVTQAVGPLVNGAGQFYLQAAGAGVTGSVDLRLNSPAWLPSTTGRAKVGTYRSPLIYIREVY